MEIYKAICDIMNDVEYIGKNSKNDQQKFMFRGIDAVMNVFKPLLAKHRVFVVPQVLESYREERQTKTGGNLIYTVLKVSYKFYAEDGSFVESIVQGEGMDSADKSSNKAMSVAFKYAMFQVFCVPTEEMKDPDAESFEESKPVKAKEYKQLCDSCGKEIMDAVVDGNKYKASDIIHSSWKKYGKCLCMECYRNEGK